MTSSEPKEVPDSALPATEDILVDQSSEVHLNNSWEALPPDGDTGGALPPDGDPGGALPPWGWLWL